MSTTASTIGGFRSFGIGAFAIGTKLAGQIRKQRSSVPVISIRRGAIY
jgi:hypothetical protein